MKKKIACFITSSWTEAGAMKIFLEKIDPNIICEQKLPIMPKRNRNMQEDYTGLTGSALISKAYEIIKKYRTDFSGFDAIIIEDDLDFRFPTHDKNEFEDYHNIIKQHICTIIGREIPVFVLYASPEIETWFLIDFKNSFEYVYKNAYFCHHLKEYVKNEIIGEYWDEEIEKWNRQVDSKYQKLSNQIIDVAFPEIKRIINDQYEQHERLEKSMVQAILKYDNYNKRIHGDIMLKNIEPENLLEKGRVYFAPTYYAIKNFSKINSENVNA